MDSSRASNKLRSSFLCQVVLLTVPAALSAQSSPTAIAVGSYRCLSYNVSGGGGSCSSFQRLELNPDGSYQFSSTRGRWSVEDGNLVLSSSKLWGPGKILPDATLRFEYDYRGWHHVLTWTCQGCPTAPASAGQPGPAGTTAGPGGIGITLTLQFTQSIHGVTGFVMVPAEAAERYQHNDPLPPGAVSGLAFETGTNAVKLTTNRDNKLPPGKRYVVFLTWARETIPVAILDMPRITQDYISSMAGNLDGSAVLAKLRSP